MNEERRRVSDGDCGPGPCGNVNERRGDVGERTGEFTGAESALPLGMIAGGWVGLAVPLDCGMRFGGVGAGRRHVRTNDRRQQWIMGTHRIDIPRSRASTSQPALEYSFAILSTNSHSSSGFTGGVVDLWYSARCGESRRYW